MGDIMRTILLSIKPEVYERIFAGDKKYEYRKRFPKYEVKAYLYVSKPIQEIKGVLYLGKRVLLKNGVSDNNENSDMKEYIEGNKYRMDILKYQETTSVSLKAMKAYDERFVIPQGFYYIDDKKIGNYIVNMAREIGNVIENKI